MRKAKVGVFPSWVGLMVYQGCVYSASDKALSLLEAIVRKPDGSIREPTRDEVADCIQRANYSTSYEVRVSRPRCPYQSS